MTGCDSNGGMVTDRRSRESLGRDHAFDWIASLLEVIGIQMRAAHATVHRHPRDLIDKVVVGLESKLLAQARLVTMHPENLRFAPSVIGVSRVVDVAPVDRGELVKGFAKVTIQTRGTPVIHELCLVDEGLEKLVRDVFIIIEIQPPVREPPKECKRARVAPAHHQNLRGTARHTASASGLGCQGIKVARPVELQLCWMPVELRLCRMSLAPANAWSREHPTASEASSSTRVERSASHGIKTQRLLDGSLSHRLLEGAQTSMHMFGLVQRQLVERGRFAGRLPYGANWLRRISRIASRYFQARGAVIRQ
eukprot:1946289-Prymnesium_polylepis.1